MRFYRIRRFIICTLERRAYRNRHKSLKHLVHWAKMNNRRYRILYPDAFKSAW